VATPRESARIDGRRLRGGRTRRRLVEAYVELVEGGESRPRGVAVASQAGVSLRTLYHHFEHLSDLAEVALASESTRQLESLPDVDSDGSLAGRIDALAKTRGELFDAAADLGRATVAVGRPTRSLEGGQGSRSVLRRQIERTFSTELAAQPPPAHSLLDAVDAVTSADAWAYLRGELGRSPAEARAAVTTTLQRLLTLEPVQHQRATSG
jgi:TetR/AcrR family transcriptional regulator, regulator of autoinduction and epiphytic fitness